MTPAEISDLLDAHDKRRPVTAPLPPADQQAPSWTWKKVAAGAGAIVAVFAAGAIVWGVLGDVAIIPRAEADTVHREHKSSLDKHERAIRHQVSMTSTLDANVRAIGEDMKIQMAPAPQPDLLADD